MGSGARGGRGPTRALIVTIQTAARVVGCDRCGVPAEAHDRKDIDIPGSDLLRSSGAAAVDQAPVALCRAADLRMRRTPIRSGSPASRWWPPTWRCRSGPDCPRPRPGHPRGGSVPCGRVANRCRDQGSSAGAERAAEPSRSQGRSALPDPQAEAGRQRAARRAGSNRLLLGLRIGHPHDEVLGAWLARESVCDAARG
jgi:hypothetical protein